jgi:hypothetical protein
MFFVLLQSKDFVDYVIAFTPSLIALFVAGVAWRQFKLGRDKLRLDLYERRFAVYERNTCILQCAYWWFG